MTNELNKINPSEVSIVGENYFALPCTPEQSKTVLLSIPWDVTVSYGKGSADAPQQLLEASAQLDLFDAFTKDSWKQGIATIKINKEIKERSIAARDKAEKVINHLEAGGCAKKVQTLIDEVNQASEWLDKHVYEESKHWLNEGKIVGLVGGDHSTPLGYIRALGEIHGEFGVLHIDAHRDLRKAYEGFKSSHASIMYNVLENVPQVKQLVQVGVRDFCDEEQALADNDPRVLSFDDRTLFNNAFGGLNWDTQSKAIVATLPKKVYISFDIDGLDIAYCPHTGTPVPGGLTFNQAIYLLEEIVRSGRTIIGFDMVEVVGSEDSVVNLAVGVRILLKLSTLTIMSNK